MPSHPKPSSIVDPHGHHLEDSLVKLQAPVWFTEEFGSEFHRIDALAKVSGKMRVLDLAERTSSRMDSR